jgi:hypothetical protein
MIEWLGSPRSTLGQLTPEALANVVFSVQAFLNDALQQANQPPIRVDGNLDRATCDALSAWSRGEFGPLDPTLVEIISANVTAIQAACDAIRGGQVPVLPPPGQAGPPPVFQPDPCEQIDLGERSARVLSVQQQINAQLRDAGYVPIPENSTWDPITCRALGFLTFGIDPPRPPEEWLVTECPQGVVFELNCPPAPAPQKAGAPAAAAGGGSGAGALALLAIALLGGAYLVTQS